MTQRIRWIGIIVFLVVLVGCSLYISARFLRPSVQATPTPTPIVLEPRPEEEVATSGLGSATVSGVHFIHPPFGEGDCGACHAVISSGDPLRLSEDLWGDELEVCLSCHGLEMAGDQMRPVQHKPFEEGKCVDCHDPHAADLPTLLRQDQPTLCADCHEEDGITQAPHVRDNPDNCLTCHLPHSSFAERLLPKKTARFCLDCHSALVNNPDQPERHEKVAMEKDCLACHNPHEGTVLTVARGQQCRDCHSDDIGLATAVSLHDGVQEGRCSNCHQFHDRPELAAIPQRDFLLRQKPPDACLTCHPDVRAAMRGPVIHQPLAEPETEAVCDTCHATHAAPAANLLITGLPTLCLECHENVIPHAAEDTSPQAQRANTRCDTCHTPHGGPQPNLFQAAVPDTCETCHQDEVASFASDPHREEVAGQCVGCHTVHRPPDQPLVNTDTCAECHQDTVARFVSTRHATLEDNCASCHNRHANGSLIPASEDNGCVACHDVRHGTHPVRTADAKTDPRTGAPLTCASCHDPHGTGRPALVRGSGDAFCLDCHSNLAATGPVPPALANSPHGTYTATTQTCNTCHDFRALPAGQIARSPDAACVECHATARTHAGEVCSACHEPHARTANLSLIREVIQGLPIRFRAYAGPDSFVDLDNQTDDLCTACHTQTAVNNRYVATVFHYEGNDCRQCHPHSAGFSPEPTSCSVCHGTPPSSGAHLAHMNAPDASRITDCATCHPAVTNWRQPGHRDGTIQLADGKPLSQTTTCNTCHGNTADQARAAWNTGAPITNCLGCHNAQNPARIAGVTAPAVSAYWQQSGHGAAGIQLQCTACHDASAPHISGRLGDATRLKKEGDALCLDCHNGTKATAVSPHGNEGWANATQAPFRITCAECHDPHGTGNLRMIRERIRGQAVVFTRPTGQDSFDEPDDANEDDLCATCHTTTAHNRVPANRDQRPHHEGAQCTDCHTHEADGSATTADAFMPVASCVTCHSQAQDNGDGTPPGGRRPVVGEFDKRTHHGKAQDETCLVCHDFSTHMNGELVLRQPDGGEPLRGTRAEDMDLTPFCQGCHDLDGATATFAPGGSPADPFAAGNNLLQRWGGLPFTVHSNRDGVPTPLEEPFTVGCQECHAAHGSDNRSLVRETIRDQAITFTALTGPTSFAIGDEGLCAACHTDMVSHRGGFHPDQNKDFSGTNCTTCHAHDRDNDPATQDGFAAGCGTRCHGQPPPQGAAGYALDETQLPHQSHVNLLGRQGAALCRTCHLTTVDTNQNHATEPRTYQDVVFDALNPDATYDPATRTCAGTACHSNGAPRNLPFQSRAVTWQNVGGLECSGCHGDAQTLDTNAHRAHLQPQYTDRGAKSITCATCHAATAANNTEIANPANHPDGVKQVQVDESALWGDPGQVTYDPATATCANSRCHSSGPAGPVPQWDAPETGACGTCHGVTPKTVTSGAHTFHIAFLDDGTDSGACAACHPTADAPTHVDGQVQLVDGKPLAETTVCDTCHSAGGPFNGAAEAKANWASATPVSCEGCHDEQPAVIKGVAAPNVVGDNVTYGIRVTGHRWGDITCTTCHERLPVERHIDGNPRTYVALFDNFNATYGLKLGGMNVPREDNEIYSRNDAALCWACHEEANIVGMPEGYSNALFTHAEPPPPGYPLPPGDRLTLFRNERWEGFNENNVPANIHWDHLDMEWDVWDSDRDGYFDSKPNCGACHDVHGVRSVANGVVYPAMTLADMGIVYGEDPELGPYGEVTSTAYLKRCMTCHKISGIRYYRSLP